MQGQHTALPSAHAFCSEHVQQLKAAEPAIRTKASHVAAVDRCTVSSSIFLPKQQLQMYLMLHY